MTHLPLPATALITGAATTLGLEAARAILATDPSWHVVVTARTQARATAAADRLSAATGNPLAHPVALDLGNLGTVAAATASVRDAVTAGDLPPLRSIVASAGVQTITADQRTADGHGLTFGTNVIGHFALLRELLDAFTAPARIVVVGSGTHWGGLRHNLGLVPAPVWRDPHALAAPGTAADPGSVRAGRTAYATSKLALIYLVHELNRRLPAGITAISFDPGLMPGTGLARQEPNPALTVLWHIVLPRLQLLPIVSTPAASGRHLAALATTAASSTGADYVQLGRETPSSPASHDPAREAELWQALTELTASREARGQAQKTLRGTPRWRT